MRKINTKMHQKVLIYGKMSNLSILKHTSYTYRVTELSGSIIEPGRKNPFYMVIRPDQTKD